MNDRRDHNLDDLADRTDYLLREFAYTRTRTRTRVRLGRLLLLPARFVGVDPRLLQECGRKQKRSTFVLAMSVLLTVTLAAFYGYTAAGLYAYGEVRFTKLSVAAAVLLASFIYIVERVLLDMLSREFKFARTAEEIERFGVGDRSSSLRSFFKLVFAFITRFTVAMLIATIVSEPLLLLIYEDDVDKILQARRDQEFLARESRLNDLAKPFLDNELKSAGVDTTALDEARLALEQFDKRQLELPSLVADLQSEVSDRELLADCELEGVPYRTDPRSAGFPLSEACSDAVDSINERLPSGAEPITLSGQPTCDTRCQGHQTNARNLRIELRALEDEVTTAPGKRDLLVTAIATLAQELADTTSDLLRVPLSPGSEFFAPSAEAARLECKITYDRLLYRQVGVDPSRAEALFSGPYCTSGPPSDDTFTPYTGLQARQDAFAVVAQCSDPYALRTLEPAPGEPAYCYISAGVKVPGGQVLQETIPTGYWSRFSGTISDTFNVPDSSLGRSAARIRWLILLLDTLPIFLKFSQSLRKYRAYDAVESFEHQAFHIALANGVSELSGDTPEEKRKRSDYLRKLLGTRRLHISGLFSRPSRNDRRKRGKASQVEDVRADSWTDVPLPDLSPDPMGATDIAKDDATDAAADSEAPESHEPTNGTEKGEGQV